MGDYSLALENLSKECIEHIKSKKVVDSVFWNDTLELLENKQYGTFISLILTTFHAGVLYTKAKKMLDTLNVEELK